MSPTNVAIQVAELSTNALVEISTKQKRIVMRAGDCVRSNSIFMRLLHATKAVFTLTPSGAKVEM